VRGLYLHIPFCQHKCVYCDFYSLETTHLIHEFVETLLAEIELRAATMEANEKNVQTIFFGGGTPSLLSPSELGRILDCVHRHFNIEADASGSSEWTMEANPGTVTPETLMAYRTLGINRLSFGVQSFFEPELKFLSRIHSTNDAVNAIQMSRDAGFENVNLDLMFALPNQSFERWRETLRTAVSLGTDHISAYSLIFEPGTPLNAMRERGEVQPQREEHDADMYAFAIDFLAEYGYDQYEVSNFAKPGKQCQHNCLYWQGDEYVSFGPSAHGYLAGTRYWNARSLKRYTDSVRAGLLPMTNSETLSQKEQMFERAFLELRARGIRKSAFMRDFGISVDEVLKPFVREFAKDGHVLDSPDYLRLTPKGYAVCDALTLHVITLLERHLGEAWQQSSAAANSTDEEPIPELELA
jgi:oxygen-independent coproporphyrinogen III oxidase